MSTQKIDNTYPTFLANSYKEASQALRSESKFDSNIVAYIWADFIICPKCASNRSQPEISIYKNDSDKIAGALCIGCSKYFDSYEERFIELC